MTLTLERLKQVLHYDPDTGLFTRLVSPRTSCIGKTAGCAYTAKDGNPRSYVNVIVDGKVYLAHRLAVFYMTGRWPTNLVDHADHDGTNNRWANLREATHRQNAHNTRTNRGNTSGLKGVCWEKQTRKWKASICVDGKRITIGRFDVKDDAAEAYRMKAAANFGKFACTKGPLIGDSAHG